MRDLILQLSKSSIYSTKPIEAVHKFDSDTTGEMFSWLRLLQPATVNELTINKVGQRTYLFSLNRQIYNFCTTSGSTKA